MVCPQCSSETKITPVYKGEKLIGRERFCTSWKCKFSRLLSLHKAFCNRDGCTKQVNYFDSQDLAYKMSRHLRFAHSRRRLTYGN